MTSRRRIYTFLSLVAAGLFMQMFLGIRCRCHWGYFNSQMIYAAAVVDIWVLLHLVVAAFRRRFLDQCIDGGIIVVTSPFWIPIIFKIVLAAYILPKGEPLSNLFH